MTNLKQRIKQWFGVKPTKIVLDPVVKYITNTPALQQLKAIAKSKKQFNKYCNVFIGTKLTEKDKELFFNASLDERDCVFLHYKNPKTTYAQILRDLGIAESTSQANGAGWKKDIKYGFEILRLDGLKIRKDNVKHNNPKRPHVIAILNNYGKKII